MVYIKLQLFLIRQRAIRQAFTRFSLTDMYLTGTIGIREAGEKMPEMSLKNYTALLQRLKFNLEGARSAIESGECKSAEELEALKTYVSGLVDTVRKYQIAKEVYDKETLTKEDIYKAMSITCYGNLGYCCGLSKDCPWRDACRQALRIDDQTYVDIKENLIWQLMERASNREKIAGGGWQKRQDLIQKQ